MIVEKTFIEAGEETLATLRVAPSTHAPVRLLMLHGAGRANKELSLPVAKLLAKKNIASRSFDFSGYGQSTCRSKVSLSKRVSEAKHIMRYFRDPIDTICAFSMSGYVALHLLRYFPVHTLLLFAPALYDKKAFRLPFGEPFRRAIRNNESWLQSDGETLLRNFKGRMLIFYGEKDDIVPDTVIKLYGSFAKLAKQREVVRLQGVGHQIALAMNKDKKLLYYIGDKMYKYIQ